MVKALEADEVWFVRIMLKMSWMYSYVTNQGVLDRIETKGHLARVLIRRQLEFLSNIMRRQDVQNLPLTGKVESN